MKTNIAKDKLCYFIKEDAVLSFLKKYPSVEKSIKSFLGCKSNLFDSYATWLEATNTERNESSSWGATPDTIESKSFGTKTFYKYDFCGTTGWAEIFEYLHRAK